MIADEIDLQRTRGAKLPSGIGNLEPSVGKYLHRHSMGLIVEGVEPKEQSVTDVTRMPVVYVPHGGGPWPFVETGIGSKAELDTLAEYLRSLPTLPERTPTALLVVSAHWEESVPTITTSEHPPLVYDYYGFPPESYALTWPAPGHPAVAERVMALLSSAGIVYSSTLERGFDHGTFVPMKLAYPEANIPTVQLSLKRGLDPEQHLAIGRALAPLRNEGIFIIGSGMTYHNLRAFGPQYRAVSETFDTWLREAATAEPHERNEQLRHWQEAPAARQAHPREEHLLPLMVIAGAAGTDRAKLAFSSTILDLRISAYHFGARD
jgi:aromatic ring-opening dioxygenase catalytic subunit (LigB family)